MIRSIDSYSLIREPPIRRVDHRGLYVTAGILLVLLLFIAVMVPMLVTVLTFGQINMGIG